MTKIIACLMLISGLLVSCDPSCPDGYKWDSTAQKCRPNFARTGVKG